jgi:peptidoglycan/xylan/chitin deacetylase (PgdA/CDA1 family)
MKILKLFNKKSLATIFMLHRVAEIDFKNLSPNENLKISPKYLENLIIELINEEYEFINLDTLEYYLINGINKKNQIVFTLDDGYVDNYELAYPIFKKYNIPFTIYITTSFPEKTAILWWYILEEIILKNDFINLEDGTCYFTRTSKEKLTSFLLIRSKILKISKNNFLYHLNNLFKSYNINWYSFSEKLCMNWEQIIELSKDNLVTIAGHTTNHLPLNKLDEFEIIEEVINANLLIQSKTGSIVNHFAYPYGSSMEIGLRETNILKKLNLKTATTTRSGNIFSNHKNFLECLPRVYLTEKFKITDLSKFNYNKFITL